MRPVRSIRNENARMLANTRNSGSSRCGVMGSGILRLMPLTIAMTPTSAKRSPTAAGK